MGTFFFKETNQSHNTKLSKFRTSPTKKCKVTSLTQPSKTKDPATSSRDWSKPPTLTSWMSNAPAATKSPPSSLMLNLSSSVKDATKSSPDPLVARSSFPLELHTESRLEFEGV